ncbi:NAD(P)H-quinone oxidoreductase [Rufibacter tibetensis]|uniref:Zinc-binding dehydrogenase n=1 Tax=Rufibacter tibetensis TaxID=512763 RepID=A0A0P0CVH0_9BACT|nr:NAD(P)H-quinone oxidoreductase [Rufibacter tibetensis]ALI98377.1 zinc-binding dehydrogenase [Rufibacter tibetensis]
MKAVVITESGAPEVLQIQEREVPTPASHQILVRVHAAGINRPDVAQRKGHYPPPAGAPVDVPGLEIAGTIEACGDHVERWKKGDAICALLPGGGYAEFAVVDARHCLPVPKGWSFEEAASLPETVFTVWHNVFQRGQLQPGETFLVHGGSSGIGITAIQLAKTWGARVFATAGTDEKCQACEELGADQCINHKTQAFEEELKAEGVDVILDMVGGVYIPKNLNLLKPDGRLVFINAMQGAQGKFDVRQVMQKRLTITGSTLRPRDAEFKAALTAAIEQHVWPLLEAGEFKPVLYKVFPLEEAAQAHALMESSEHIGKIVLKVQP